MASAFIALAALLTAGGQTVADSGRQPTVAASPAPEAGGGLAQKEKRYCVESYVTGSRLPTRTCMTRDRWLARGFDPLSPDK